MSTVSKAASPSGRRLALPLIALAAGLAAMLTTAAPARAATCELKFYYNDDGSSA